MSDERAKRAVYEPIESGQIQGRDLVYDDNGHWRDLPHLVGQPISAGKYAVIRPVASEYADVIDERDRLKKQVERLRNDAYEKDDSGSYTDDGWNLRGVDESEVAQLYLAEHPPVPADTAKDARQAAERAADSVQDWAETTVCIMSSRAEGIDHQAKLILDEFAPLLAAKDAEISRLRAVEVDRDVMQARTEMLVCGDCKVDYDVSIDKERCDCAHRETWTHEWQTKREGIGWNKFLEAESERDKQAAELREMRRLLKEAFPDLPPYWGLLNDINAALERTAYLEQGEAK
jgi:hypothetical protein